MELVFFIFLLGIVLFWGVSALLFIIGLINPLWVPQFTQKINKSRERSSLIYGSIYVLCIIFIVISILIIASINKENRVHPTDSGNNTPLESNPSSKSGLASQIFLFGSSIENGPSFSINPPSNWLRRDDHKKNLLMMYSLPDRLHIATIESDVHAHLNGAKSIDDYKNNWQKEKEKEYPNAEFMTDGTRTINGLPTYFVESKLPGNDNVPIHQVEYIFYVNNSYGLFITGSVPETYWDSYKDVIKASIESVKKV